MFLWCQYDDYSTYVNNFYSHYTTCSNAGGTPNLDTYRIHCIAASFFIIGAGISIFGKREGLND